MTVQLNHTIVAAKDNVASSTFMAEMLGLPEPTPFGPFMMVEVANGVTLDFMNAGSVTPQHYAFLISEAEFDEVFERVKERELQYWADPMRNQPSEINRRDGGRGMYFEDPDGHFLEVLTRPYGSGN